METFFVKLRLLVFGSLSFCRFLPTFIEHLVHPRYCSQMRHGAEYKREDLCLTELPFCGETDRKLVNV